uniref:Uncharacterized protein n=1 Tax=Cucumis melo TaxID=3656 RepID=A0A9I9ED15_CUCME
MQKGIDGHRETENLTRDQMSLGPLCTPTNIIIYFSLKISQQRIKDLTTTNTLETSEKFSF